MRSHASLVLALLPLALAQTPFPVAFRSGNSAQISSITSLVVSYVASAEQQAAFTTAAEYMATATGLTQAELNAFNQANGNPIVLGDEFFTATATPAWYTQIPSALQSYVSSVANAEASIALQVVGDARRVSVREAVVGAVLGAAVVGVLLL